MLPVSFGFPGYQSNWDFRQHRYFYGCQALVSAGNPENPVYNTVVPRVTAVRCFSVVH